MSIYKQGRPKVASMLKGIVNLNPTKMVFKLSSETARSELSKSKVNKSSAGKPKGK